MYYGISNPFLKPAVVNRKPAVAGNRPADLAASQSALRASLVEDAQHTSQRDEIHFAGKKDKRSSDSESSDPMSESTSWKSADALSSDSEQEDAAKDAGKQKGAAKKSNPSDRTSRYELRSVRGGGVQKPVSPKRRLVKQTPDTATAVPVKTGEKAAAARLADSQSFDSLNGFIVRDSIDVEKERQTARKQAKINRYNLEDTESESEKSEKPIANSRPRRKAAPTQFTAPGPAKGQLDTESELRTEFLKKLLGEDLSDSEGPEPISYKKSPFGPQEKPLGFQRVIGMEPLKKALNRLLVRPYHPTDKSGHGLQAMSQGIMLYGPTGSGKTFLAKAAAEEAKANYLEMSSADLLESNPASKIKEYFNAAAETSAENGRPTVLALDNVEMIGRERGEGGGADRELPALLNSMQSAGKNKVFVVASTTRPDQVDSALGSKNRLNRVDYVAPPQVDERKKLLAHFIQSVNGSKIPLNPALNLDDLARKTNRYSPADLKELVGEAYRNALDMDQPELDGKAFAEALDTVRPSLPLNVDGLFQRLAHKFKPNAFNQTGHDKDLPAGPQIVAHTQSLFGDGKRLGFQRIAGMGALKKDLSHFYLDVLRNPGILDRYPILKDSAIGMLMYGPPGCGKTYFAQALAEEANANFSQLSGGAIGSIYIHGTVQAIREAFDNAAATARETGRPTIMLIDEVDTIAPSRAAEDSHQHNREEMGEFLKQLNDSARKNVFVIATTNNPQNLDSAMFRPGRIGRKVYVGPPDRENREQLLRHYIDLNPESKDETLNMKALAEKLKQYASSDIKALVVEAANQARQNNNGKLDQSAFDKALAIVKPSLSERVDETYKQAMAHLEPQQESDTTLSKSMMYL